MRPLISSLSMEKTFLSQGDVRKIFDITLIIGRTAS